MKYKMQVSRAHSGMDFEAETLDEVIARLEVYIQDFPDEVVKVKIFKVQ